MATVSDGKWTIIDGVPHKELLNVDDSVEPSEELRRRYRRAEYKETIRVYIGITLIILQFVLFGILDILISKGRCY